MAALNCYHFNYDIVVFLTALPSEIHCFSTLFNHFNGTSVHLKVYYLQYSQ